MADRISLLVDIVDGNAKLVLGLVRLCVQVSVSSNAKIGPIDMDSDLAVHNV
jgi:hypothetical protein